MKRQIKTKPQAEINMVLAAGAPETQTKHGHKGFGGVSAERGLRVGATFKTFNLFSMSRLWSLFLRNLYWRETALALVLAVLLSLWVLSLVHFYHRFLM